MEVLVWVAAPLRGHRRPCNLQKEKLALMILRCTAERWLRSRCTMEPTYLNVSTNSTLCPPSSLSTAGAGT
eukprot:364630-Chlamydomonas_euryale.AAC.22